MKFQLNPSSHHSLTMLTCLHARLTRRKMCCSSQTSEVSHDICARKGCTTGLPNSQRGQNAPAGSEMLDCAVTKVKSSSSEAKSGKKGKIFSCRPGRPEKGTNGLSSGGFEFRRENTGLSELCPALTSSTESCDKPRQTRRKKTQNADEIGQMDWTETRHGWVNILYFITQEK